MHVFCTLYVFKLTFLLTSMKRTAFYTTLHTVLCDLTGMNYRSSGIKEISLWKNEMVPGQRPV